jgi:hypothetical protein
MMRGALKPDSMKEIAMADQRRDQGPDQGNEGEGNRTADKEYVERTKRFIDSGKVKPAAEEAKRSMDSPEADKLRKAEEEGKRHGHGER